MNRFKQELFNRFVVENGVIGFFDSPIVLKSGRTSHWYVNWRRVSNDVFLLHELTHFLVQFLEDLIEQGSLEKPDCLYGVPEGATKLGILSQHLWASMSENFGVGSHILAMGRAKPKEHGAPEDKFFVGMPRGKTLILEDVTTTGGSLLNTIDQLLEAGVTIVGAVGLTSRMELRDDRSSVAEAVATRSSGGKPIPYFHMSDALNLLPVVRGQKEPAEAIVTSIETEFRDYGVQSLKW